MRSNGLTTILNGALGVCLAAAVILCLQYIFLSRDLRQLNAQIAGINAWRNSLQAFAAECVEYSKKNPAILPVLETVGLTGNKAAGAAKPAK